MPKKKTKSKKNTVGNWRGIEDHFFNKVRKGFINLLKPSSKVRRTYTKGNNNE
jgi:hypothetical protein|tara:strand:+ start:1380 stop:1538 length:159 start_codon:yes stop_codon:yes gene_type:complete